MNCAIYARVSTVDQKCELQLREVSEYVKRRGWTVGGEYVDTGWSGAKASRPQLDRLMSDASQHRFDCVLVWKLDRFSRSVLHLNEQLAALQAAGVRFIATSQALDTDQANPTSRLLLQILGAVAEFEREMIRERVKAGMNAAKHKGSQLGRPRTVFDRTRVLSMRAGGASVRDIAQALKIGRGTVERALAQGAVEVSQKGVGARVRKSLISGRVGGRNPVSQKVNLTGQGGIQKPANSGAKTQNADVRARVDACERVSKHASVKSAERAGGRRRGGRRK